MSLNKFTFGPTNISGLFLIEPKVYGDHRGFFMEYYNHEEFTRAGIGLPFVQDNHSRSGRGVLRGLHFQKKHPQGKLIRVVSGIVYDVTVDLRRGSPTFSKWFGIELSAESHKMVYVPRGCAHGFLTLTDDVDFMYKCTDYYDASDEAGLAWDDPTVGVDWPLERVRAGGRKTLKISERDKKWPKLSDLNVDFDYEKYKI
jgi:dTDP-4-dehydrorhamnose 3,5-epimerase